MRGQHNYLHFLNVARFCPGCGGIQAMGLKSGANNAATETDTAAAT